MGLTHRFKNIGGTHRTHPGSLPEENRHRTDAGAQDAGTREPSRSLGQTPAPALIASLLPGTHGGRLIGSQRLQNSRFSRQVSRNRLPSRRLPSPSQGPSRRGTTALAGAVTSADHQAVLKAVDGRTGKANGRSLVVQPPAPPTAGPGPGAPPRALARGNGTRRRRFLRGSQNNTTIQNHN